MLKLKKYPLRINLFAIAGAKSSYLFVFGLLGFIKYRFDSNVLVRVDYNLIKIQAKKALFYTYTKIINNFYDWVSKKSKKSVSLAGLGFKFRLFNSKLLLVLGYSHIIKVLLPSNIKFILHNNRNLDLFCIDLISLNNFIYNLRRLKPPEPYKGKGILIEGTNTRRKESKKVDF